MKDPFASIDLEQTRLNHFERFLRQIDQKSERGMSAVVVELCIGIFEVSRINRNADAQEFEFVMEHIYQMS